MDQFWKFVFGDWYFAFPMFGMILTALVLVFWRIFLNYHAKTNLNTFLPEFQEKLTKEGLDGARAFCAAQTGMIPRRLYVAGLDTAKQGLAAMRRAMANTVELEILPELKFLLPTILAIAKIATMVGLLGTVISMIGTFTEIEQLRRGGKDITTQSGSIGLALFATALGLVTAIPLVFAHVLFKAWIEQQETKMKNAGQKLIYLLQTMKPAAAPAAAAPAAPSSAAVKVKEPSGAK
jgi:biopolymer transport protein ExbB